MNRRYIVEDIRHTDNDISCNVYDTIDASNSAAEMLWYHLTPNERQNRTVTVAMVTPADLTEDAFGEDGSVDWTFYHSYHAVEGAWEMPGEHIAE